MTTLIEELVLSRLDRARATGSRNRRHAAILAAVRYIRSENEGITVRELAQRIGCSLGTTHRAMKRTKT